ncbi:uncharacterized protein LOC144552211 isoform X1 [Carex rostrata]
MLMRPIPMAGEPGTTTGTSNGEGEEEGEGEGTSHTKDWLQLGLSPTVNIASSNEETRFNQLVAQNQPSNRGSGSLGHPMIQGGTPMLMVRPPLPWARSMWSMDQGIGRGAGIGPVNHVYRGEMHVMFPPPVRPLIGIWFKLQTNLQAQTDTFLPQITKSYLRIKDGRVTVRLLIKYLVNKLGLTDESEVEISCRGHVLPPILTLQQVRDTIWCSREAMPPLIDNFSTATDHIMTLQYSRKV